jgi:anti-anti-sigma factor
MHPHRARVPAGQPRHASAGSPGLDRLLTLAGARDGLPERPDLWSSLGSSAARSRPPGFNHVPTVAFTSNGATISLTESHGRVQLTVVGEFDELTCRPIHDIVNLVADRQQPEVVVECSDVRFASSAFLAELINLRRAVAPRGGSLRLAAPSPPIVRLLEITDLGSLFTS